MIKKIKGIYKVLSEKTGYDKLIFLSTARKNESR